MKFLWSLFNHSTVGKRSLEDVIRIVILQMRACGHTAFWDPQNDVSDQINFAHGPGEYNVIVEGFTPQVIGIIAEAHERFGARFLCLATEEPTEAGFNHGTQKEMVERQGLFPEAMQYFDGILHLVPGAPVAQWYGQFAPTAQAELGFAPGLLRPQPSTEPAYPFGFYGSLTSRRKALLQRLANRTPLKKAVRIVADFKTGEERDAAMQDSRVVVQVRKFAEMGLVSSSRCNTALCCGRPVVAEPHDLSLSHPWDDIVRFTQSESEFLDIAMLTAPRWRDAHARQFEKFQHYLTPDYCIGEPLRRLHLQQSRRAA